MKRTIAILLALVLALSLCACSSSEYEKYAKYADLFEMLEEERYEDAVIAIVQMANGGNSESDGGNDEGGNKEEEPKKPTDEERELLWEYAELCSELSRYAKGEYASVHDPESDEYLEGTDMLAYIYKRLQEIDSVDHWITQGTGVYDDTPRDRQKVLEGFAVVEDVLYKSPFSETDHMGNVSDNYTANSWQYDETGRLTMYYNNRTGSEDVWQSRFRDYGSYFYEYDETGKVKTITRKSGSHEDADIHAIYTPAYDAAGNEISCTIKDNSGERIDTFTYDAAGRMIGMIRDLDGSHYVSEFTYDGEGRLVEETCIRYYNYGAANQQPQTAWKCVYTYEGDVLKEKTVTRNSYGSNWKDGAWEYYVSHEAVDTVAVECDSQNRVILETTTYGESVNLETGEKNRPDKVSRTVEYIYGDYYLYTPAE